MRVLWLMLMVARCIAAAACAACAMHMQRRHDLTHESHSCCGFPGIRQGDVIMGCQLPCLTPCTPGQAGSAAAHSHQRHAMLSIVGSYRRRPYLQQHRCSKNHVARHPVHKVSAGEGSDEASEPSQREQRPKVSFRYMRAFGQRRYCGSHKVNLKTEGEERQTVAACSRIVKRAAALPAGGYHRHVILGFHCCAGDVVRRDKGLSLPHQA